MGKCKDCKWWDLSNPQYKSCRRNPPNFVPKQAAEIWNINETTGWWPLTDKDNWCGEFESKCDHEWVNADFIGADLCHKCKMVRPDIVE